LNQTPKEAIVRRFHPAIREQVLQHLDQFLDAFHFAKRLKALKGLIP
jgi:hypothetical protein